MRDHSGFIEKTRHEATRDVLDAWEFVRRVEQVDVPDALGRVAATNVVSPSSFNAETMKLRNFGELTSSVVVRFAVDFVDFFAMETSEMMSIYHIIHHFPYILQ